METERFKLNKESESWMSYKEFVPTAQAGSGYASHDNAMSPTLGKYLERSTTESMPYWSPATRRAEETDNAEYNSIEGIVEASIASQLAPSATEFIPGGGIFRMQSLNGLNLQAAAWVPPFVNTQQIEQQQIESQEQYDGQGLDTDGDIEAMVEVSYAFLCELLY